MNTYFYYKNMYYVSCLGFLIRRRREVMNLKRSKESTKILLILCLLANFTYENIFADIRTKVFVVLMKWIR